MDRRVDITDTENELTVQFSYSVEWYPEQLEWKDRLTRYTESRFVPSSFEIHWLSIINSFVLVLLLTAFLTIIMLRILKNDFSRYMELDDEALEEEEVTTARSVRVLHRRESASLLIRYWYLTLNPFRDLPSVGLETYSRRRLSLPRKLETVLCRCRNWQPSYSLDRLPFVARSVGDYFDDATRIYHGRSCGALLLDILRGRLHSGPSLSPDERQRLDSLHHANSLFVPRSRGERIHVGKYDRNDSPIYKCFALHCDHDRLGAVCLHFASLDGYRRVDGQEVCQ